MCPDRPLLARVAQISESRNEGMYRRCNSDPGRRLKSEPPSRLASGNREGPDGWREAALGDPGLASA